RKVAHLAAAGPPELSERPSCFNREVRQAFQMSLGELGSYIDGLHRAGFDVATLMVQWHKKMAYPLMAPVSMLLAIPFAFLVGTRGAIGGVALGVGIGAAYWAIAALVEAMGGVGQLPPLLAGWWPDIVFFFLGLYFFFKMRTYGGLPPTGLSVRPKSSQGRLCARACSKQSQVKSNFNSH